jgi:hypothetical protein
MATRRWRRRIADCTATSSSTTTSAPIRLWGTEHPPRCMSRGLVTNPSKTQSHYLKFGEKLSGHGVHLTLWAELN